MKIEISDDLLAEIKAKYGFASSGDIATLINDLIRGDLNAQTNGIDATTGCKSRQAFIMDLASELQRCAELQSTYATSFLCFDIDDFASYGDRFGHAGGDIVLRAIGAQLQSHSAHVYRFGGDEFVVSHQDSFIGLGNIEGVKVRQCMLSLRITPSSDRVNHAVSLVISQIYCGLAKADLTSTLECDFDAA